MFQFRNMNRKRDQEILDKLGKNLRQIRKSKHLSQEELANKAEIERSQISRIERGKQNPTITTLILIARVLETEVQSLLPTD